MEPPFFCAALVLRLLFKDRSDLPCCACLFGWVKVMITERNLLLLRIIGYGKKSLDQPHYGNVPYIVFAKIRYLLPQ